MVFHSGPESPFQFDLAGDALIDIGSHCLFLSWFFGFSVKPTSHASMRDGWAVACLGLDGQGGADPTSKTKVSRKDHLREGSKPVGPGRICGSVHASPVRLRQQAS
jgi:hypothetical protein